MPLSFKFIVSLSLISSLGFSQFRHDVSLSYKAGQMKATFEGIQENPRPYASANAYELKYSFYNARIGFAIGFGFNSSTVGFYNSRGNSDWSFVFNQGFALGVFKNYDAGKRWSIRPTLDFGLYNTNNGARDTTATISLTTVVNGSRQKTIIYAHSPPPLLRIFAHPALLVRFHFSKRLSIEGGAGYRQYLSANKLIGT